MTILGSRFVLLTWLFVSCVLKVEAFGDEEVEINDSEPTESKDGGDYGLCLGVACHHDDCEGDLETKPRCRDYDRNQEVCDDDIDGCFWIPLPMCGDIPCLDLHTNDEETTHLFFGTLVALVLLVFLCMVGWILTCCCCYCRARQRRSKRREEEERRLVQQEIEERNRHESLWDETVIAESPEKDTELGQQQHQQRDSGNDDDTTASGSDSSESASNGGGSFMGLPGTRQTAPMVVQMF